MPSDLLNSLTRRIARVTFCTDSYGAMAEVCRARRREIAADAARPSGVALLLLEPTGLADAADLVSECGLFAPGIAVWKYEVGANKRLSAVVEEDVAQWIAAFHRKTAARATQRDAAAAGVVARPEPVRDRAPEQRQSPTHSNSSPLRATPPPSRPLRLAGRDELPEPSGPLPEKPEIVVRPQPAARAAPRAGGSNGEPRLVLRDSGTGRPEEGGRRASDGPASPRSVLSAEELRMLLGDDPVDEHGPNARDKTAEGDRGGGGR